MGFRHFKLILPDILDMKEIILKAGRYQAKVAPDANMIVTSLTYNGAELLEKRGGLIKYVEKGSSMGVPLLFPWANRVSSDTPYQIANKKFSLASGGNYKKDDFGRGLHGLLTAARGWSVLESSDNSLVSSYNYNSNHKDFSLFPFTSNLTLSYQLDANLGLIIDFTLLPLEDQPVAFGWHPYILGSLLDDPRGVLIPLDREQVPGHSVANFDNQYRLYKLLNENEAIKVKVGEVTVKLEILNNYPYVLIWEPPGTGWVCIEPMTANIDPWKSPDTKMLIQGEEHLASFSISAS